MIIVLKSKGRGFESRRAYHEQKPVNTVFIGIYGLFVFFFAPSIARKSPQKNSANRKNASQDASQNL